MNRKTDRTMALDLLSDLLKFLFDYKRAHKNRVVGRCYMDKYRFEFSEILMKKFMNRTSVMIIQNFLKSPEPLKTWFMTELRNKTFWDIVDVSLDYCKEAKIYTVECKIMPEFWDINYVIYKLTDVIDSCKKVKIHKKTIDNKSVCEVNVPCHIIKMWFDKTELDILTTQNWLYCERDNKYKLEQLLKFKYEDVLVKIIINPSKRTKVYRFKFVK